MNSQQQTLYISQIHCSLVLQGRVGAHKIGEMRNKIYVLLQIFSGILLLKITEIGMRLIKVL